MEVPSILTEENVNFLIMVATVSCVILASALRCGRHTDHKSQEQVIIIPDSLIGADCIEEDASDIKHKPKKEGDSYVASLKTNMQYILALCGYFGAMVFSAVLVTKIPKVMLVLQHFGIAVFIMASSRWCFRSKWLSNISGVIFCVLWLASIVTPYRWILNNLIVCLTSFMTSHLRFKNFKSLQIFLWVAFFYDVGLLNKLPQSAEKHVFSMAKCDNLLCDLSTYSTTYDLPTVFSIQIGSPRSYVYLGAGDIVVASLIANYTAEIFKSTKYVVLNVVFFACSVLILININAPFPALLTIVPSGTSSILISAAFSKRLSILGSSSGGRADLQHKSFRPTDV